MRVVPLEGISSSEENVDKLMLGLRVNYQLDAIFVYFSSTCFGLIRPSSGAIEL